MRGMKMFDWKRCFILQSRRKLAPLWAEIRAVWREITADEQPTEVCEKPYRTTDPTTKVATQLKWMLLKIYRPQVAFELRVTEQRPKSRMGYYVPAKRIITIHGGWGDVHSLEEIAIHEYAHHVHFTEHRRSGKKDTPHGPNFWRIYSALVAKAIEKGLYNDNYIDKIIEQEDE